MFKEMPESRRKGGEKFLFIHSEALRSDEN